MGLLIIDDSVDARRLLQCLLRAAGNKDVLTAASMKEAFAHLAQSSRSDRPRIDLILLHIDMPEIDGIEACRRLKADHRLYDTPIIMVTAYKKDRLLAEVFAAGAMDYITKPFARVELLARVCSALTLKRETDARKVRESELKAKNRELRQAMKEIRVLRGLIKICSFCKKIQNDQGSWQQIEIYIREHSKAEFSQGVCAQCARDHYPGLLRS